MKLTVMIAACLLCLAVPAAAEECGRTYFVDQYRVGVAALSKKDTATAGRIFRTLANEGFAPAQRRLGELLLAEGAAYRGEALAWLRVALLGSDDQASDSFADAKASAEESDAAFAAARAWRPSPTTCMNGFLARVRGGGNLVVGDFADNIKITKEAPDRDQIVRVFVGLLSKLYAKDPAFLPYLRALPVVAIGSGTITAAPMRRDGQTELGVNWRMLANPDPRVEALLTTVMEGIRTAVHDRVDPPSYLKATHRGRTILAIGHRDATLAMDLIRRGIDLADTLPPDLHRLASTVKTLRYEAPSAGVDVKAGGTYVRSDNLIWFKKNPRHMSPSEVAANLVGDGVYADFAGKGDVPLFEASRKAAYEARRARDLLP